MERKLVPIIVLPCSPPGLLMPQIHIGLVDEDQCADQFR
jgi:hypothetical protein